MRYRISARRLHRSTRLPGAAGRCLLLAAVLSFIASSARGDDSQYKVVFKNDAGQSQVVEGKIVVEAQDGSFMLRARDGILWSVFPKQLRSKKKTAAKCTPLNSKELGSRLRAEFGRGFRVKKTKNFVIVSNAGRHYTDWCALLLQRVHYTFLQQWKSKTLALKPPAYPLPVIIFADRKSYAAYATKDAGPAMASSVGYYSIRTNRIVLLDLSAGPGGRPARSRAEVHRKVAASPFNVATIAHEATHQIAYNTGLHTRFADNPLWLTEGMAMYFESPEPGNPNGWTNIGRINPFRIGPFRKYLGKRPKDSLQTLVSTDKRFSAKNTAGDAYAESWALTYFLIKERRGDYEKYLALIAKKPRIKRDSPKQRWADFKTAFGDPKKLDAEFLRFLSKAR